MISYDEALARIAALGLAPRHARRPLVQALGRVLAEDVRLAGDVPPFDRAAMDGFALAPADGRADYRLVGAVTAGDTFPRALVPGEAVRIATGAAVPAGTTVVPWEKAAEQDGIVTVADPADRTPGRNTARRGEDGHAGDTVIAAGTRLTPVLLATAAMARCAEPLVIDPPRVVVTVTGDEVGGAIPDANGPLVAGLLARWGCPCDLAHAGDDLARTRAALARATAEVVVTTGGVGGSDRDLVKAAAIGLGFGEVFHGVAMQPGKPVLCMRHGDGRVLVGLPGNPVSVLATAHLVLAPVLDALGAATGTAPVRLPLAQAHRAKGRRHLFQPARRTPDGRIALIPWNGSGDLLAAAAGTHLASLPAGADLAAGDLVECTPYADADLGALPPRV